MPFLNRLTPLLLTFLMPFPLFAQAAGRGAVVTRLTANSAPVKSSGPVARKFDEFTTGIGTPATREWRNEKQRDRELRARFARYAAELRRVGARPYAITYSPRVVEWEIYNRSVAGMRAGALWTYLTPLGFDWRQINWVNGGFREEATTELWVVPPGAQPPCPTPTARPGDVAYCPSVSVAATPYVPNGRRLQFKAVVQVNDRRVRPTFTWEVSRGKIVEGQGTDTIKVEEPEGASGDVVAKVLAHGYSLECPVGDTSATSKTTFAVSHFKSDAFGNINCETELAILDDLAIILQNDPALQADVVIYGGRAGPRNQALSRAARMKSYLVQSRRIEPERIITIDGGYRDGLEGELWLSPVGAGAPPLRPTIDRRYVRLKGQASLSSPPCSVWYFP